MLEVGKIYDWKRIVIEYPNMWVFITDIKEKNGTINTCRLLAVCSHQDKAKYIIDFKSRGISFECERTSFSAPNMGVLC
jgi:hypothetical protein